MSLAPIFPFTSDEPLPPVVPSTSSWYIKSEQDIERRLLKLEEHADDYRAERKTGLSIITGQLREALEDDVAKLYEDVLLAIAANTLPQQLAASYAGIALKAKKILEAL
jgi:hypothetical protein